MVRIALVHSFYSSRQSSGENVAVESEVSALRRAGHEVELFAARTDDLEQSTLNQVRAGLRVASGRGRGPLDGLRQFRPDWIHVHNLFPNFSRQWARSANAPIVVTVHNFRHMCSNGLFFRDGAVCTLCADGHRWAGVRYRCYRDSRVATFPISWANRRGPAADPVLSVAQKIIVLSELQRQRLSEAGLAPEKLVLLPNFLPRDLEPDISNVGVNDRRGWLYVGRLSSEKGIVELLRRWPNDAKLTVAGDGPLHELVASLCRSKGISFLGPIPRHRALVLMSATEGLVLPSVCFEGCPLVYLEAMAAGTPVLAWEPSGVADFVRRDHAGWVLPAGADPRQVVLRSAWSPELGARARLAYEMRYSESAFIRRLVSIFS